MGEKMSLEQVREQIAAVATADDYMLQGWIDTLDAHITQPAQAVDVGAEWRPFYASVIQSLAVLARAQTTDDGPREAILRDTVMGEVVRIRTALDRFSKTMRTAALPKDINGAEGCDA